MGRRLGPVALTILMFGVLTTPAATGDPVDDTLEWRNRVRLSARGIGQYEETNKTVAELLRKLLAAPPGQAAATTTAPSPFWTFTRPNASRTREP